MNSNYYILLVLFLGFLHSCGTKKWEPPKLAAGFNSVEKVLDNEFITSDTISQKNIGFMNSMTKQEVAVIHHVEETGFTVFNDLMFKTENIGVIVGGAGLITRITKDGGKTWLENRFSRFGNPFYAAAFSGDTIFVIGDSEYIFKTPDYGKSWSVFNTKPLFEKEGSYFTPKYYKTHFVNDQIGFIAGSGYLSGEKDSFALLLKTIDAGENWTAIAPKGLSEDTNDITDFVAFSEKEIRIVTSSGRCYKTEDGGLQWKLLYNNAEENVSLNSIAFLNPEIGLIGGLGGDLFYTSNGGEDWQKIEVPRLGKGNRSNISDIVFLNNSALITTAVSYSEYRETFVYEIDVDGTNMRPFLTTDDEDMYFMGDSYGIEALDNAVYILDRDDLYKTTQLQ